MNSPSRTLSPSEWRIFYLLSRTGPLEVRGILAEIERQQPGCSPAYTTILTLAQRLVSKGYVTQRPTGAGGTAHLFTPQVPFETALVLHVERFLADTTFYNPTDLQAVRAIIDQHLASA